MRSSDTYPSQDSTGDSGRRSVAESKTILCMKWGTKYSAADVNRLYGMIRRHLSYQFQLICFTDDAVGLAPEIKALPLPLLDCEEPQRTRGKWRKLALWDTKLEDAVLYGPALFIDLDSIIVDNIDSYFDYGSPKDVILERNWAKPLSGMGQTSVFRFCIGSHPEILQKFCTDPQSTADRFKYEQHFVTHCIGNDLKFWPRGWTRHFRLHCLGPFPLRYIRAARIPIKSKIITFPGGPNPSDAVDGRWVPNSPPYKGRVAHLKRTLSEKNWRDLQRFVMPVDWISDAWE
jgi:hypothetical protein